MIVHETPEMVLRDMTLDEYTDVCSESLYVANAARTEGLITPQIAEGTSLGFYCGIESNDQARSYLRHGWHDGVKRLLALKSAVELPPAQDRRRRLRRGPDGEDLDIDRALRGDWDNAWWQSRRVSCAGTPTIDLVGLTGGNAMRGEEAMFWSGATAVVLVDALEAAGYSVRLIAGSVCRNDAGKDAAVFVTLKDAGEPLRSDVVAAVMCHGGMHRTHMFRARLTLPTKIDAGMGATRGWDHPGVESAVRACGFLPESAILLSHTYDLESCRSQIQRVIARLQGGE